MLSRWLISSIVLSCRQALYFAREIFDAHAELKTSVAVRREEIVAEVNFS